MRLAKADNTNRYIENNSAIICCLALPMHFHEGIAKYFNKIFTLIRQIFSFEILIKNDFFFKGLHGNGGRLSSGGALSGSLSGGATAISSAGGPGPIGGGSDTLTGTTYLTDGDLAAHFAGVDRPNYV